jgi:hypothetical protein
VDEQALIATQLEARRRRLSRIARAEGFIAFGIMLFFMFGSSLEHYLPHFGRVYDLAIGTTLLGSGWLCSISGVRHASGQARVAAAVSLFYFALLAIAIFLAPLAS